MASFFNRLYKYKQSDLRHQKENFLTEILAYCLENDKIFQNKFLQLINLNLNVENFECKTQLINSDLGRPDILIKINNNINIIIECKVDAAQETTQLKRYSEILIKSKLKKKILIYLTKYYEETETFPKSITFRHIRWNHIFELLDESTDQISKEFQNYLNYEKMSKTISFNKVDFNSIKSFQETLGKMNDFLMQTKDFLSENTSLKFKFSKELEVGNYGITTDFYNGKLWIGFYQYEHNDEVQLCISFDEIPLDIEKFKELDESIKMLNWDFYDNDTEERRTWHNSKSLSEFMENNMFNTKKAHEFLEIEILKIKKWL